MATAGALNAAVHGSQRAPVLPSTKDGPEARHARGRPTMTAPGCCALIQKRRRPPTTPSLPPSPLSPIHSPKHPPPPPRSPISLSIHLPFHHPQPPLPRPPSPSNPTSRHPCSSRPTRRRTYPLSPRITIFSSLGRPAMVATPPPPSPPTPPQQPAIAAAAAVAATLRHSQTQPNVTAAGVGVGGGETPPHG